MQLLSADGEPLRRYHKAIEIMGRISRAYYREAWEDGEILDDVMYDLNCFLSDERAEQEIFKEFQDGM